MTTLPKITRNDIHRAAAAVRADPQNPDLWVALGSLMAETGERDKARDCYERALRLNPNHAIAKAGLAQLEQPYVTSTSTPMPSREYKPTSAAPTAKESASDTRTGVEGRGVTRRMPQEIALEKSLAIPSSLSLTSRALLAVALTVGFYTMAIAIVGGLFYIPYAEWTYVGRIHLRLAFGCILTAIAILWAILPRKDHFIAPGPVLEPNKHPKLFETLTEVATAANQEMPSKVYLLPEMNAWVTERGGIMGFGGRRVMGLGLPLLQLLTVSQLRAILAHEFGHYYGGDTKLGPWIYKTRTAIVRTIVSLAGSLIQKPFLWYGKVFLRITHAISRQQEFVADQIASHITGSQALVEGLRVIHGGSVAFELYWVNEVVPVLSAGFHPPLADGFDRFVSSAPITDIISQVTDHELANGKSDPYDTHPPLRDRIAAVEGLPQGEQLSQDPPAISLVNKVLELETRLLSTLADRTQARPLKPVRWEDVGAQVYFPMWEDIVRRYALNLAEVAPAFLPEVVKNLDELSKRLGKPSEEELSPAEQRRRAAWILGVALAVILHRQGWILHALPGDEAYLQRGGSKIKPFETIQHLASGELRAEVWQQQCAAAGISELNSLVL